MFLRPKFQLEYSQNPVGIQLDLGWNSLPGYFSRATNQKNSTGLWASASWIPVGFWLEFVKATVGFWLEFVKATVARAEKFQLEYNQKSVGIQLDLGWNSYLRQ